MERLCERPGCSDPASVGYGMRTADQVFWLEARVTADEAGIGVLCTRHAEAMVVPRGWTVDDRRDPELRLFTPPKSTQRRRTRAPRRSGTAADGEQLRLDDDGVEAPAVDESWTPAFDTDDDLDGLLSASSPLLARAFRGDGRRRR